jgi:peptidyl-prolyl cis-trans isomerase C
VKNFRCDITVFLFLIALVFLPRALLSQSQAKPAKPKTEQENPSPTTNPPSEDPSKTQAGAPRPAINNRLSSADPKTPLGEVNGQKITLEDLKRLIDISPQLKTQFDNDDFKQKLLDNFLQTRAFYLEGVANKADQDPDLQLRYEMLRQQMIAAAYVNKEFSKISVSDEDLRTYFDEHKKEFEIPEQVNASHILVKTEEEAREIKKQLDGGADFAELAKQKSLDTTNKNNGGNLGFFLRGAMVPAFEEAAFKLKPGQISDPVKTSFGYHIIKILEVRPRSVMPLNDARKMIQPRVQNQKQQQWLENKRQEVKSKYGVKIYENLFPQAAPSPGEPKVNPPSEGSKTKPEDKKPVPPKQ